MAFRRGRLRYPDAGQYGEPGSPPLGICADLTKSTRPSAGVCDDNLISPIPIAHSAQSASSACYGAGPARHTTRPIPMKLALPASRTAALALLFAAGDGCWRRPWPPTATWSAYTAGRLTPPWAGAAGTPLAPTSTSTRCWGCTVAGGPRPRGQRATVTSTSTTAGGCSGAWSDGMLIIRTERFRPPSKRTGRRPSAASPTGCTPWASRPASTPTSAATAARRPIRPTTPTCPGLGAGARGGPLRTPQQDIALFFETWGFDYIKVDGCGLRAFGADAEKVRSRQVPRAQTRARHGLRRPLRHRGRAAAVPRHPQRPGQKQPGRRLRALVVRLGRRQCARLGRDFGNLSRTSDDITPSWSRMLTNFDSAAKRAFYAHRARGTTRTCSSSAGAEFDAKHLTEARSHFSLWAMLNAPLFIGMDVRKAPESWSSCWTTAG